jgi:hypothetical protein
MNIKHSIVPQMHKVMLQINGGLALDANGSVMERHPRFDGTVQRAKRVILGLDYCLLLFIAKVISRVEALV